MKFMGSKARIAKDILPIILADRKNEQWYVEPFGGGANSICEVSGNRIYSDINECLSECLRQLSSGWIPPEFISRDFYAECRDKFNTESYTQEEMCTIGYVGVNGSYGGRWFDGGYAGISTTKHGKKRNYPLEAFNNVMHQSKKLIGCTFKSGNYKDIDIPQNSIIYCDPPYSGTKEYIFAKKSGFDSSDFWQWCRDKYKQGHKVFVSEYHAPSDFVCVWEKDVKSSMRANALISGCKKSTERLFTLLPGG